MYINMIDNVTTTQINDAVNKFMATGDKKAFSDYVTSKWEIFSKDPKAKKELEALLDNPVFTADAGDTTKKQTKEQRAIREKLLMQMIDQSMKELAKPGDTTLATVGGKSVVDMATKKVKEVADSVDLSIRGLFASGKGVNDIFDNVKIEDIFGPAPKDDKQPVINIIDNKQTNVSSSGGSSSPAPINNVISKSMYDRNWQFNSLAGGYPQT
jgi:hypothetical protein